MDSTELKYWIALNKSDVVGYARFTQLLKYYGSAQQAWLKVTASDLYKLGWYSGVVSRFIHYRKCIDPDRELAKVQSSGVTVVTLRDKEYPDKLGNIPGPPPVLYIRGNLEVCYGNTLAVVGSRRISAYGRDVTKDLVGQLVEYGFTVVSGLAFGVDVAAHQAVINNGGSGVAVLASGVDVVTPVSNIATADSLLASGQGAIVSEFPLGEKPKPFYFPIRNRIISGLSLGVLVVEAARRSGTLITARYAGEQGREVFAVPGSIFSPTSVGTAKLIQDGAKLVVSVQDIIDELKGIMSRVALPQKDQ